MTVPSPKIGSFSAPLSLNFDGGGVSARRLELLAAIGQENSINGAAKAVGMTYKGAWEAVEAMNNLAGVPLVTAWQGGRGGGRAELTEVGQRLVGEMRRITALQTQFFAALNEDMILDDSFQLLKRIEVRTSARNAFTGIVESVRNSVVDAEVTLRLASGEALYAIITQNSVRSLDIVPGKVVYALIKASWVLLTPADEKIKTSARNRLCGVVSHIEASPINTEVLLDLGNSMTLAAIITNESHKILGLTIGSRACALIKASHIIIGVD
ncbi:MAG: molybdate transport system regulatory protein [Candidatus Nitrotoga sp. LAW]|nr:MAG: molybdate transport system regulatory protein [Candidatus Nitrotoga sp. LAW]